MIITTSNEKMLAIPRAKHKTMQITPVLRQTSISKTAFKRHVYSSNLVAVAQILCANIQSVWWSKAATEAGPFKTAPSAVLKRFRQPSFVFANVVEAHSWAAAGEKENREKRYKPLSIDAYVMSC